MVTGMLVGLLFGLGGVAAMWSSWRVLVLAPAGGRRSS